MVERGDEDPKCAALRSVLSEMAASETSEASKDIFDVDDSLEDTELAESGSIVGAIVENDVYIGFSHQEAETELAGKLVYA